MSREKELFIPRASPRVSFYSCGPTVYDFAHIGNFRAFLTYDVLKRWLAYLGFEVEHVCNLTDIDDKIIARMQRDNLSLEELTEKYANYFFEDLAALNIVPADKYPRATEHVDDIVSMVAALLKKGVAYEVNNSVYFDVSKAARYGRLARLDTQGMAVGASEGGGLTEGEQFLGEKRGPRDFALWKAFKPEADAGVAWDVPWGSRSSSSSGSKGSKGRPGWHIECSAMAKYFFGDHIDLHAGGVDLVFPHHENEIAQSEAFTGYGLTPPPEEQEEKGEEEPAAATEQGEELGDEDDDDDDAAPAASAGGGPSPEAKEEFCKYWVHNGFVNVDNEKMSKSKGNFVTLRGRFTTPAEIRAFRYLIVTSQYRMPLNFNEQALKAAQNALKKLDRFRGLVLQVLSEDSDAAAADAATVQPGELSSAKQAADAAFAAADVAAGTSPGVSEACLAALHGLRAAMDDDLNTPRAAACLFGLLKKVQPSLNAKELCAADAAAVDACLRAFNAVLGVFYDLPPAYFGAAGGGSGGAQEGKSAPSSSSGGGEGGDSSGGAGVPAAVLELVEKRSAAKEAKDWALADELRAQISEAGFDVKDRKGEPPLVTAKA